MVGVKVIVIPFVFLKVSYSVSNAKANNLFGFFSPFIRELSFIIKIIFIFNVKHIALYEKSVII